MENDTISNILNAVTYLEESHKSELAYITITGKNENYIRDKIAFYLHKQTKIGEWIREFKRMDIAYVNSAIQVTNYIEITSLYTFDILYKQDFLKNHIHKIRNDFTKNVTKVNSGVSGTIILAISNIDNKLPANKSHIFKYNQKQNSILKQYDNNKEKMFLECNRIINESFPNTKYHVESKNIILGEIFKVNLEITFWIITLQTKCTK